MSLIPAWFHTFVEIDQIIISTVILLLPLIQEGLLSVTIELCARSTGFPFSQACSGKNVVMLTDCLDITIAVGCDVKPQTNKQKSK